MTLSSMRRCSATTTLSRSSTRATAVSKLLAHPFSVPFLSTHGWSKDGKLKWKPAALLTVKASQTHFASARLVRKTSWLHTTAVKNELVTSLLNLRAAGTPIDSSIICPFILGLLQARCPQIFDVPVGNKSAPSVASRQCASSTLSPDLRTNEPASFLTALPILRPSGPSRTRTCVMWISLAAGMATMAVHITRPT